MLGVACVSRATLAQDRLRRIGFLTLRAGPNEYDTAFREALKSLGYIEGRTIRIDYRWADGSEKAADTMAADLVERGNEVLVVATAPAIGVLIMDTGATLEPVNSALAAQLQPAARQLGLQLSFSGIRSGSEIPAALARMQAERLQAVIVGATPLSIDHRQAIAEIAARHRLPAMYEAIGFVDAGGLLSYGPSLVDMYRRAAIYVDKILKGAKPADLPIELPTRYELAINLQAAKSLGLQVPRSLLVRADRVID